MKYLIYELFSGVGFCNQLFSFETAIYLANISDRKLILLVRNPLCHCGKSSWDYGKFLDFFSDDYKRFLPYGIEVYYNKIPNKIKSIIESSDNNKLFSFEQNKKNRFSTNVFVESKYSNNPNINSFCNGRTKVVFDFNNINQEYFYINTSNASRCFYNFYTSNERYKLMSDICFSLTNLNLNSYYNHDFDLSIHLRLGDYHRSKTDIDNNSMLYMDTLIKTIDSLKAKNIVIMCDRKDGEIINTLKNKYNIKFTDNLIKTTNNPVKDFLLEKNICEQSNYFIGTQGSTVSNYINYNFYLANKRFNMYTKKTIINNNSKKYSWCLNNTCGHSISWSTFWEDNIYKIKMLTCTRQFTCNKSSYVKIVKEININPNKNKKIISFCLYGLNDERNRRRYFDKGVYVNYHYMKKHNYKDWILRVYIPHDEPSDIIENIKHFGDIEIVLVDTNICLRALRFLPNDDPNVKVWISRDLDSIINTREEKAVEDWLKNKNDKELMIMSDYHQHTWTIAGGMFGKINNDNNDITKYIVDYSQSNNTNINKFANDCLIAEQYFYNENNYIQYYGAGKKLKNSVPFPDLSAIHCNFVGNISPIMKYYNNLQLEKLYPFLSNKSEINKNDKFLYNPWKCFFKNSEPECSVIWKGDDFVMTVDPKKETGVGTWKTLNGDGKKLLKLNTHIQILWEDKKYVDAYMPNKETISVKHDETWYNFHKYNTDSTVKKKLNRNIYLFWTGDNIMGANRKRCYENFKKQCGVKVTLVTKDNLTDFIVPGHPIHPAYKYLSLNHHSDYLRCYFMYHYGGGYSDIKETTGNWNIHFDMLENSDKEICGYPELRGQAASSAYKLQKQMGNTQSADQVLIGCGNFICKPKAQITTTWYEKVNKFLDSKLELLRLNPADNTTYPCKNIKSGYPIFWNHLMGNIFHEVCYLHNDKLLRTLPKCVCSNYREHEGN